MKKSFSYPVALVALLSTTLFLAACAKDKKSDEAPVEAAEIDNGTGPAPRVMSAPPRDSLTVTQNELNNLNQFLKLRDVNAPAMTMTGSSTGSWGVPNYTAQSLNGRVLFQLDLAGVVATTWPSVQSGEGSRLRLWIEVPQRAPLRNYVLNLSNRLIQSAEVVDVGVQQNFKVWSFKANFGGSKYDVQLNGFIYKPNTFVTADRTVYMQGEVTFVPDAPHTSGTFRLGTFNNISACASLASAPTTLLSQVGCQ